ncbi:MAG: site-2 protease family protein, partial [Bacteroidota bacterium]|nr:site-2 protease family protein [Bacteroidota bacterium]
MEILIKASQLILGLSILVVIHELGHYLAARAFGIRVEKFYLFFDVGGVKLFKFKKGETEYGVGWLPLGGYVKITGMIDESMDKEFMSQPAEPHEFRSKPTWQRLIVMLGGIIMNVLLGILIFWGHTFYYGDTYIPASEMSHGITAKPLAQEIGLKSGDRITEVNGIPVERYSDILDTKIILDKNIKWTVERGDSTFILRLPEGFAKKALKG